MATATAAATSVPKRLILVLLCFLATALCYIDRVNISVAIIPMAKQFHWSNTTKGEVLSSFFIGYLLMMTPGGWLSNRYGGRVAMGAALTLWSLFTLLTPLAAAMSFATLIAARILMGVGEAVTFPAIVALYSRWLPMSERTRGISFMFAGIPAGTIIGLTASGFLVSGYGWRAAFYFFGVIGLAYAVIWFRLVHSSPDVHPTISSAERAALVAIVAEHDDLPPVPWGRLLRKKPTWALIINHTSTT
jgi:ACS family sodium-dependent inorganic phosphate cotransporter